MTAPPRYGPPFGYIADPGILVMAIPNDLRLRKLPVVADAERLASPVREIIGVPLAIGLGSGGGGPVTIVSYKPERSCLVRCLVGPGDGVDGEGRPRTVFGRAYRDERGAFIHHAMSLLWSDPARDPGVLSVAEPLGYDPRRRMLFQAAVPGAPLGDRLAEAAFPAEVAAAARGLAAIHRSPVHLDRLRTAEGEVVALEQLAPDLTRVLPDTGQRLQEVVARLAPLLGRQSGTSPCLIHGDFSLNQVMMDGRRASIIDFDRVSMGERYTDLGHFLAHIEKPVIEGDYSAEILDRAATEFRASYEAARGSALEDDILICYQALGFVRFALSSLRHLQPGWRGRTERYLARAEALLRDLPMPSGRKFAQRLTLGAKGK